MNDTTWIGIFSSIQVQIKTVSKFPPCFNSTFILLKVNNELENLLRSRNEKYFKQFQNEWKEFWTTLTSDGFGPKNTSLGPSTKVWFQAFQKIWPLTRLLPGSAQDSQQQLPWDNTTYFKSLIIKATISLKKFLEKWSKWHILIYHAQFWII